MKPAAAQITVGRVLRLRVGQRPSAWGAARPASSCRQSHLRLFGQFQGVINIDAKVAYGALDLGVPKQ